MEINKLTSLFALFGCQENGKLTMEMVIHLVDWGLIPKEGEYKCPNGHLLKLCPYDNIDGWLWRCFERFSINKKKKEECGVKISIRSGTFLERSHLSAYKILAFAYLFNTDSSLSFIEKELEIDHKTAVDWNSFCREVVIYGSFQTNLKIGGPGIVVEIDESKVGKRKYHRGHLVKGTWVFGGVERMSGKCFIVPVENRSREVLIPIIKKHILPGSIIVSDFLKAYDSLPNEGYEHIRVNHSLHFKDPETGQHTNTIEGLWRLLKVSIPAFNRREKYFNGYVQKFIFLRWCKANNNHAFTKFLNFAGKLYDPLNPSVDTEEMQILANDDFDESLVESSCSEDIDEDLSIEGVSIEDNLI